MLDLIGSVAGMMAVAVDLVAVVMVLPLTAVTFPDAKAKLAAPPKARLSAASPVERISCGGFVLR